MNIADNKSNKWYEDFFLDAINATINTSVYYDESALTKLEVFDGKVIKVVLESTPFTFFMIINKREIKLAKTYPDDVDTTIKGTPLALFAMNSDEPIEGIKSVEIQGDASTGQFFAKWLKNVDPDWQEAWQDLLGDGIGEKVSNVVSGLIDFSKKFKKTVITNTSKFLVDESRDLIAPEEMEEFIDDVEDLQSDTDRLAQQISAMKNK